jgi:predicted nucleic acid-binding protein
MAIASAVFFDTSILVSAFIEMGETPSPAEAALDAISDRQVGRPLTAWHCVLEFYSVATRLPGRVRMDPHLAGQIVRNQIIPRFEVCDLPSDARRPFIDSMVGERVAGGRVYDAHIAETARLAGAEMVVTDNRRHFVPLMRYGIRVLTAAEFAEEYGT